MAANNVVAPRFQDLFWPTLEALKRLGGSGTIQEIEAQIHQIGAFSDEQWSVLHKEGPQTQISYELHWARTYLKRFEAVDNSQRGVWSITDKGRSLTQADMESTLRQSRAAFAQPPRERPNAAGNEPRPEDGSPDEVSDDWREQLLEVLLEIPPATFERLCQRLLREQGFVSVTVTGSSGDGGIDGTGVLRLRLLSFQMFFQCKRYRGSVGAAAVRDFRGAMVGRSDKGLLITTGTFTPDAIRESGRDGAPPIDLVDGEQLCTMLKELRLGVDTEQVERVTIDQAWFRSL